MREIAFKGCRKPGAGAIDHQTSTGRRPSNGCHRGGDSDPGRPDGGIWDADGLIPDVREVNARRLADVERDLRTRMGGAPALYRVVGVAPWHPAPEMRALRVPVDSSSRDQVRPMSTPAPVIVREGRDREPEAMSWDNRWRKVSRIDEQWSFDLWWMSRPIDPHLLSSEGDDGGGGHPVPGRERWLLVPAERLAPTHRHDLPLHRASLKEPSTPLAWEPPTPTSC